MTEATQNSDEFVFLGVGFSAYSMARAVYEATGKTSLVLGDAMLPPYFSVSFIRYKRIRGLRTPDKLLRVLKEMRRPHTPPPYLFPLDSGYLFSVHRLREVLSPLYTVMAPKEEALLPFLTSEERKKACDRLCIPTPRATLLPLDADKERLFPERLGFFYPAILKPADGLLYAGHPFPKMRRLYIVKGPDEVREKMALWYRAGYTGKALLEERIEGSAESISKLFFYSDQNGKVKLASASRVLYAEKKPSPLIRYPALLSEELPPVARMLTAFLERLGYTGFSEFTVKYDLKSGKPLLLSASPFVGEGFDLLRGAGENPILRLLSDSGESELPYTELSPSVFWHALPRHLILRKQNNRQLLLEAEEHIRKKEALSPFPPYRLIFRLPRFTVFRFLRDAESYLAAAKLTAVPPYRKSKKRRIIKSKM